MFKYLYCIIRHVFPRKRWEIVEIVEVVDEDRVRIGEKYILCDQFGNMKIVKTY